MSRWRYRPVTPHEQLFRALDRLYERANDRIVSAAYVASEDDDVLLPDTTGAAFAITLPKVDEDLRGKLFTIVKTNAGANNVTVQGTGGQTIDGAASVVFNTQFTPKRYRAVKLTAAPTYGYLSA